MIRLDRDAALRSVPVVTWHAAVFNSLLLGTAVAVVFKGGAPERSAMVVFLAGDALSVAALLHARARFQQPELGLFLADAATFACLVVLAVNARRSWPAFMAGMQGGAVAVHLARLTQPGMLMFGYAFAEQIWSYPMVLAMLGGVWQHRLQLKRNGHDRPWSACSPWSTSKRRRAGPTV